MRMQQQPIPPEALPPGWGPVEACDDAFVYRHSPSSVEVHAVRDADNAHPVLGPISHWEVGYRYSIGELPIDSTVGRVSVRSAALEAALECMRRIHENLDYPFDPIEIEDLLESVSIGDRVPEVSEL